MAESKELALNDLQEARLVGLPERFQPRNLTELMSWSKLVVSSGLAPKGMNEAGVVICVQMGAELSITPTQALQNIAVINGRPSIWGDLALALFKRDAKYKSFEERSPEECLKQKGGFCRIVMQDGRTVERTFSEADAQAAGLLGKPGPWQQYKGRMYMFRARSWAMRDAEPGVFKGLAMREEQEEIIDITHEARSGGEMIAPRRKTTAAPSAGEIDAFVKAQNQGSPATATGSGASASATASVDRSKLAKVMILDSVQKTGGGKTFYVVKFQGTTGAASEASTFSESAHEAAVALKGGLALIETAQRVVGEKTYTNLIRIEPAPAEESPAQDEPGSAG